MSVRGEVEQFLYYESRLLDEGRLEEWLDLFTADAQYWLPVDATGADPSRRVSLIYDDVDRLRERIRRLRGEFAHAQEPASRVCRTLGNIEVAEQVGGEVDAHAVIVLVEARVGRQQVYAGRCRYRLRNEGELRISRKELSLVTSEHVIDNLTVIL